MELDEYLQKVKDKETFLEFTRVLLADRKQGDGWKNDTIEDFLQSAIDGAEQLDFGSVIANVNNPWEMFAIFLIGGKINKSQ